MDESLLAIRRWSAVGVDFLPTLKSVWEEEVPSGTLNVLHIGKLLDFQWRLGVHVTSNRCSNLKEPFVVCAFTILSADGETAKKNVEMSLDEFKVGPVWWGLSLLWYLW